MSGKEELQKRINDSSEPLERMSLASYPVYGFLRGSIEAEQKDFDPRVLFASLGALAGFSCVLDIVYKIGSGSVALEQPAVVMIETTSGEVFYSGDLIIGKLAENKNSVFSLAAGGLEKLGCAEDIKKIDIQDMFKRTAETLGGDEFGTPQLQAGVELPLPKELLSKHFSFFHSLLSIDLSLPLEEYFGAFALAFQSAIEDFNSQVPPKEALEIFMEYAVPMAKVNPKGIMLS